MIFLKMLWMKTLEKKTKLPKYIFLSTYLLNFVNHSLQQKFWYFIIFQPFNEHLFWKTKTNKLKKDFKL